MHSTGNPTSRRLGFTLVILSLAAFAYLGYSQLSERRRSAASAPPPAAVAETSRQAEVGAEVGESPAGEESPAAETEPVLKRMWWNMPRHYEAIGLEPEQRDRMNARVTEFLAHQAQQTRKHQAFQRFRRALTDGDLEAARESTRELGDAYAEPLEMQAEMMVDVLEMLTAEQYRLLTTEHPGLLSGPWLLARGLTRGQPGTRLLDSEGSSR